MKVLIVGAGIGGLTLAGFLKDSQIDFEMVERKADWNAQGFSLGLWNNGRNILKKLGLEEKFDKVGSRIQTYRICDGKGVILRTYNLSEFYSQYGLAYTHVDRALLHDWLFELIPKERVRLGVAVEAITETRSGVSVAFTMGEVKTYDLVVGSDGIHSQVRELVFGKNFEIFDDWRVWYAWIDNEFKQDATVTEYIEPGEFVGVFDVGPRTLAVLIAPAKHSVWDDPKGRLIRLKELFKDEMALSGFLAHLKDQDVIPTNLSHVKMTEWVKGRVALLGDSAHGFEPHAGLGGSMAMEDGYVFAGELMKVSGTYSLAEALQRYQAVRKKRVATARTLTNRMRAWALIESRLLRRLVNILIPFIPQSFFTKKYHQLLREEI